MSTIKNNYNYTIQIMHFFEKRFKLYMVLANTFFKPYISKICIDFSLLYIMVPKPRNDAFWDKGFRLPIYLFLGFLTLLLVVASNAALTT